MKLWNWVWAAVQSHRLAYGMVAVVYAAAALGVDKVVVSAALMVVYGWLAWRG